MKLPLLGKSNPDCEESFLELEVGDCEADTGVSGLLGISFEQEGEP